MAILTRTRSSLLALFTTAAVLTAAFSLPSLGDDEDCDRRIVPIDSQLEGRGYDEWSAAWWQWATAFAPDVNPILDGTGAFAGQGQTGRVYFLAGNFGGTTVRDVTIPRDVNLFLPIANSEWDTTPNIPNPLKLPDPLSVADIRKIVSYYVADDKPACEIDGERVRNLVDYRVKSPVFSLNLDPDFATFSGYPAPYVRTAVSDGYWLMLKPLGVGHHVIHFTASNPTTGFQLDVTYKITVAP